MLERMNAENPPVQSDLSRSIGLSFAVGSQPADGKRSFDSPSAQTYLDELALHCLLILVQLEILSRHGVPLCLLFKNIVASFSFYFSLALP